MSRRLEQLEAELKAHELKCPYTHNEAYGDKAKEAARKKWRDEKDKIREAIETEKRKNIVYWHDADGQPTAPGWKPDTMPEYPSARPRSKHYNNAHPWQKGIGK